MLENRGVLLGEPYTRQLDGKLRALRFWCGQERIRVTYRMAPGRRIIMLTVLPRRGCGRRLRSLGRSGLWRRAGGRVTRPMRTMM